MNSMLYKAGGLRASPSLMALSEWQEKEKQALNCAVDEEGCLLDNLTLELRVHPPEIHVDNVGDSSSTIVTIDSANRPGSLVFVVQHFTELGLRINRARISSDGGWFHDMFQVSEVNGAKVKNPKKIQSIKQMLNVYMQTEDVVANGDTTDDANRVETTVFEASGVDRPGLLADLMQLMTQNGCDVRSAAVWTYRQRVAFVFSVTEKGRPIADEAKTRRLNEMMSEIIASSKGSHTVRSIKLRGVVHHDRRLHQLMLEDDISDWRSKHGGESTETDMGGSLASPFESGSEKAVVEASFRSPKYDKPLIDISHFSHSNYWTVNIKCRDRTKLLLDTVCTLADMNYDIYHATIDADNEGYAHQEYFIRPRSGEGEFNPREARLVKAMLEASIERRFPKGMKVHVRSIDRFGCMAALTRQLHEAGLSVTRAKVRTYATSNSSGHTLYVMNAKGGPPDREQLQNALLNCGGKAVDIHDMSDGRTPLVDSHRFSFTFLQRGKPNTSWGGSPESMGFSL